MDFRPHIASIRTRYATLENDLSSPDLYSDPAKAKGITREHSRLKNVLAICEGWERTVKELAEAEELLAESSKGANPDADMIAMATEEVNRLRAELPGQEEAVRVALLPPDDNDDRNTIVEIRAGTGGDEAALFAADLYRMYTRYAEKKGWKQEVHEISPGEMGGVKEVIFLLTGEGAYREMRFESGVHRVQRVPATETQGRIHTSAATVAVLPEAEEVDIQIKADDLRIEVCRSGGPGGQGVNTTDSAVQILHIPTGLIVRCQDGRSQIKNREKALSVLRSRLLKKKQDEEAEKYAENRRSQIGGGERSDKIRTYNFPQNRITDHRINESMFDIPGFLEGGLEPFIKELIRVDIQERLQALNDNVAKA
ncbi:peptide chain release factor 1 [Verrucomicrobium sp. GAS474]|uniref:peptide chain release factor 1 n=1 Tax=Verrucomicrobium sp. GAS474 TaxID=1882831 RepID=UPI00087D0D19|nr:peptide chain release factor 1 [Verrucomicrobium sp. GAS474]SDU19352.1 peptide chain release factor 1 [Verrucomicrobium sp. GAS474]